MKHIVVLSLPGCSTLRLNLAHFGSDLWVDGPGNDWISWIIRLLRKYPNVYTDVSCWNLVKNRKNFTEFLKDPLYKDIRNKILFGTDWYLTQIALLFSDIMDLSKSYREFCEEFKELCDSVDKRLWLQFTLINPYEFFDLGNENRIDNLYWGLHRIVTDKNELKDGFKKIKNLKSHVSEVKRYHRI